jgi:hypothetical protein
VPRGVDVTVPRGVLVDGGRRRDAVLRPLAGEDEAFLLEDAQGLSPAARTTALLARCLERLGPVEPVGVDDVRGLVAGDREALLLELRRLSFGDRLECVLACPGPECGEELELELGVDDLLVPVYPDETVRAEYEDGGLRFRLPDGGDLEAGAEAARDGLEAGVQVVRERCVLAGEADESLDARLAALDPQAEIELALACPECGRTFTAAFDAGDFLAREVGRDRDALLREIHLLGLHYHWPESELMAMTPRRRKRYLNHLVEALGT